MSKLHALETSESNYPLMQCHIQQQNPCYIIAKSSQPARYFIFTMHCTTKIWTLFYHYPKLCTQLIYSIHYTI